MKPTYEQLAQMVIRQKKIIENQEMQIKTYEEIVEGKDKIIETYKEIFQEQDKLINNLRNELQKYHNENTPSGSIPPYLKDLEKNVKEMTKDTDKDKARYE